jgi:DNA topoisomerase-2
MSRFSNHPYLLPLLQSDNAAREAARTTDSKGKKVKKRQAVLETRKSIGKKRNADSDDDFVPIKANLAQKKFTTAESKPKTTIGKSSAKKATKDDPSDEANGSKKKPTIRKASGKKVKEESDSDSDVVAQPENGRAKAKVSQKRKS